MDLIETSEFSRDELFARLRQVPLRGFDGARPYADARFEFVEALDTDRVTPAQNYVLREGVERILALRSRLADRGIDPFRIDGGVTIRTSEEPSRARTLIPPIVEESVEDGARTVWLVADGMHRVYAARSLGLTISVVLISNVSYPYYAFPLENGWDGVEQLDYLPPVHQKKIYRQPDNYKALFRDFNAVFSNIQLPRAQSNPSFLRSGE
jgi:hypothetical protein